MKYLHNYKIFESEYNKIIPKEDLYKLQMKFKKIFNILGFGVNLTWNSFYDNHINIKFTRFQFLLDVNKIPYSIVNLITRDIVPKEITNKFDYKPESIPTIFNEEQQKETIATDICIFLSKVKPYNDTYIPTPENDSNYILPKNTEEAFNLIIKNVKLNLNKINDEIYSDPAIMVSIPNFRQILLNFINTNSNYNSSEIIIPDTVIVSIIESINKLPDSFNVYNEIKIKQPFIYDKIIGYNPNVNTAGKLGEIGF